MLRQSLCLFAFRIVVYLFVSAQLSMHPFFPTIWNVFHDGTIERLSGSVPGEVRIDISIEYLRERFDDQGDEFILRLHECSTFEYRNYEAKDVVVTELGEIEKPSHTILSSEMAGSTCVLFTDQGRIEMQCEGGTLTLESGRQVAFAELVAEATAYWDEWERKAKQRTEKPSEQNKDQID